MTAKIKNYQLALMLFMSRLLAECINFPFEFSKYTMQRFIVIIIAKIIIFAFYIPLIMLASKRPGENFFTILSEKSKVIGWFVFVLMGAQLLIGVLAGILKLEFFISNTIMSGAPSWLLVLLMGGVAIYGTLKGLQVIARIGLVLFVFFILMMLLGTFSLLPDMKMLYLYPSIIESPDTLWRDIIHEFCLNNEIFIFAVLCRYVDKKPSRAVYMYLPSVLAMILYMTFFYIVMFGPYIDIISFPFYTLSSLVDIIIFNRLDGLDVIIWTLAAVLKMIMLFVCIESMLYSLIKEKSAKRTTAIIGIATFSAGIFFAMNRDLINLFFNNTVFIVAAIILVVMLPSIALILKRRNKDDRSENNPQNNQFNPEPSNLPEPQANIAFDELE